MKEKADNAGRDPLPQNDEKSAVANPEVEMPFVSSTSPCGITLDQEEDLNPNSTVKD